VVGRLGEGVSRSRQAARLNRSNAVGDAHLDPPPKRRGRAGEKGAGQPGSQHFLTIRVGETKDDRLVEQKGEHPAPGEERVGAEHPLGAHFGQREDGCTHQVVHVSLSARHCSIPRCG